MLVGSVRKAWLKQSRATDLGRELYNLYYAIMTNHSIPTLTSWGPFLIRMGLNPADYYKDDLKTFEKRSKRNIRLSKNP